MSGNGAMSGPGRGAGGGSVWQGALPAIAAAAVAVVASAAVGYALAGPQATAIVVIVATAVALVVIRLVRPPVAAPPPVDAGADKITVGWSSYRYWRNLTDLRDGMAARAAYEARLRPALEHLLAARLAERHGVNLYRDPAEARRVLCRDGRDRDLWAWIDPALADRDAAAGLRGDGTERPGIPRRTLERLINRLEQL
jgi:hypothetical protein